MPFTVPGIGYAGLGQQTAAAQLTFRKAAAGGRGLQKARRSKRKKTYRRARRIPGKPRTRRTRGASSRGMRKARMVKGSAAAKRHMAKLRRMIKRR